MKTRLSITAALLAGTFALSGLYAEPSGEQILEECIMEAYQRGYDIEDDSFAEGLAEIIENEDEDAIVEVCPKTYAKYPD